MLGIPDRVIARTELSGTSASETLSVGSPSLPFTKRHLVLRISARASAGTPNLLLRINGDTSGNYNYQNLKGAGGSDTAARTNAATSVLLGTLSSTANEFSGGELLIPAAFLATFKSFEGIFGVVEDNVHIVAGNWADASAITSVTVFTSASTFASGTVIELAVVDEMYAIAGAETILTADGTFTVEGLPQLPGDCVLIGNLRSDASATLDSIALNFNDDTTAGNYLFQRLRGTGSTADASASTNQAGSCPADTAVANAFGPFLATISNVAGGVNDPHSLTLTGGHATSSASEVRAMSLRRNNVEALIKSVVTPNSGTNFKADSMLSGYHAQKNVIAYKKLTKAEASVTLAIPSGYRDIVLKVDARTDESAALSGLDIQLNSDTTAANYDGQRLDGDGSSATATPQANDQTLYVIPGASAGANIFGGGQTTIFEYTKTDRFKHLLTIAGAANDVVELGSMSWKDTPAAVIQIVLTVASGDNFVAGSIFTVEGTGKPLIGWEDQSAKPTIRVEIDWDGDDLFANDNSDVSGDLFDMARSDGRNFASMLTGRATGGKATVKLRNNSDLYSTFNTGGALFGKLLPNRRVRIMSISPVVSTLFEGEIDSIKPSIAAQRDKIAVIEVRGPLANVSDQEVEVALKTSKQTGTAVTDVLDAANWSSTRRDIDTGQQQMAFWWVTPKKPLTALREIEDTEAGFIRESHRLGGYIAFEGRHHRLNPPHTVSQATFSDNDVAGEFDISAPFGHDDPVKNVFNEFRAPLRDLSNGTPGTLWTLPGEPELAPGEVRTFWIEWPILGADTSQNFIGATWTVPLVEGTDYTGGSSSGQTDKNAQLGVTETAFMDTVKIIVTNNDSAPVFLSLLQVRGTPLVEGDRTLVSEEDSTSQSTFGERRYNRRDSAKWIFDFDDARNWCLFSLSIYKNPTAVLALPFVGNVNLYRLRESLIRDVSDRISIDATGTSGLGIDEDFFVERIQQHIGHKPQLLVKTVYHLSSASQFSDFWVLGKSALGTSTRLAY